ncbi:hypothetical protein GCM10009807_14480 [Microbacterium lacus]|uniref:Uncharacterized protein n=1 Tax=Microbacterium lacus TaxID=415217 RepID=A0ABP4SFY0_9MICO
MCMRGSRDEDAARGEQEGNEHRDREAQTAHGPPTVGSGGGRESSHPFQATPEARRVTSV